MEPLAHTKEFVIDWNDVLVCVMADTFAIKEVNKGQYSLLDLTRDMEHLRQCVMKINDTTMQLKVSLLYLLLTTLWRE